MKIIIYTLDELSEGELSQAYGMMSDAKKERVARLRHEEDRRRSVIGDYAARVLISEKTGIPPEKIDMKESAQGKPYIDGRAYFFSIAHSDQMVACAIAEYPIGIDVERIRPIAVEVIKYACSDKEWAYVTENNERRIDREGLKRFYEVWTSKEALVKLCGRGLDRVKAVDSLAGAESRMSFEVDDYIVSVRWHLETMFSKM